MKIICSCNIDDQLKGIYENAIIENDYLCIVCNTDLKITYAQDYYKKINQKQIDESCSICFKTYNDTNKKNTFCINGHHSCIDDMLRLLIYHDNCHICNTSLKKSIATHETEIINKCYKTITTHQSPKIINNIRKKLQTFEMVKHAIISNFDAYKYSKKYKYDITIITTTIKSYIENEKKDGVDEFFAKNNAHKYINHVLGEKNTLLEILEKNDFI